MYNSENSSRYVSSSRFYVVTVRSVQHEKQVVLNEFRIVDYKFGNHVR
jgi:hypothetical protein